MSTFIHLGYPKTGTTFLQKEVFPRQESVNLLGKPFKSKEFRQIVYKITTLDEPSFKREVDHFTARLATIVSDEKPNLLTVEGFLQATRYQHPGGTDFRRIFSRLQAIFSTFGDVRFFFVIRNHTDALCASYNQFRQYWDGYGYSKAVLLDHLAGKRNDLPFVLDNFKYHEILSLLYEVAPPAHVAMFFYEDLKRDNLRFAEDIFRFIGCAFDREKFRAEGKVVRATRDMKPGFLQRIVQEFQYLARSKNKYLPIEFFRRREGLIKAYYAEDLGRFEGGSIKAKFREYGYLDPVDAG